jgi:hypothetical protein
MSLTINSKAYGSPQRIDGSSYTYYGPGKTVSVKDDLRLSATAPKPTASFSGLGRTSSKLTRTLTLTGALTPTGDVIAEMSVSLPAGYADADVDTLCADLGAFIASSSFKASLKQQQVGF